MVRFKKTSGKYHIFKFGVGGRLDQMLHCAAVKNFRIIESSAVLLALVTQPVDIRIIQCFPTRGRFHNFVLALHGAICALHPTFEKLYVVKD